MRENTSSGKPKEASEFGKSIKKLAQTIGKRDAPSKGSPECGIKFRLPDHPDKSKVK